MIKQIILSIKKQLTIYNNKFNNKLLEYYNNVKLNHKLKNNVYELTGIIYFLLDNKDKYQIGININNKPISCYYRKKSLSLNRLKNFEMVRNNTDSRLEHSIMRRKL